jgi:hypothetical protein
MRSSLFFIGILAAAAAAARPAAAADADDLARIRKDYADVLALSGPARDEILAFARLLRRQPEMAIDFTHLDPPQHCLNTGGDMLHVTDDPAAKVALAYIHPAKPLVDAGLDVTKLAVEPETSAEIRGDAWYYYPGGGRIEPFHGRALGAPMIVRTVGARQER